MNNFEHKRSGDGEWVFAAAARHARRYGLLSLLVSLRVYWWAK